MAWSRTLPEDERLQFVVEIHQDESSVAELARAFGVSQKTAYKWLARFESEGVSGLVERSRAPHSHPHAVSDEVEERLVEVRAAHPTWGPRKLLAWLNRHEPELPLPVASTVALLLKRRGLSKPRRRHRRVDPNRSPFAEDRMPNDVWCVDFKGQFRLGDGSTCYPLTVTDAYSRYLLACIALKSTSVDSACKAFRAIFRRRGLPTAIRTDNGVPFASKGPGALTTLNALWIQLGIRHDRIEGGHPEQNGRHERMHLTLEEAIRSKKPNLAAQQRAFDAFQDEYNNDRPHEALGQRTPATLYAPSTRLLPRTLPALDYPAEYRPRVVTSWGTIRWHDTAVIITRAIAGLQVGLVEVSENHWDVYFGHIRLGSLSDERPYRLVRPPSPPTRIR
jgi:putative transposase